MMAKKFARKEKDDMCEKKLNRSGWFMRIAAAALVFMLLETISVFEITTATWVLLGISITFLVLGLVCGIDYLKSAFQMRKTDQLSGDA